MHTVLAGGVSDRRFSRWYTSDLRRWLRGEYKRLAPGT
jgi:penicillin amidase